MSFSSPPPPDTAKPANIKPDRLDTNQQARALPWWTGPRWLSLYWLGSQPYNYREVKKPSAGGKGGKGGGTTTTSYCDVAGVLACCTLDSLRGIRVNGEIVWEGIIDRGDTHPEHTGDIVISEVGTFRIHWGTETAAGDWLMLGSCGEEHPHYRGQPVVEAQGVNCGSGGGGTVPNIEIKGERSPVYTDPATGLPLGDGYALTAGRVREGVNPVTALCELLQNDFFGLGRADLIDFDTAEALAAALGARTATVAIPGNDTHEARMGLCAPYLTDRQSFATLLAGVLEGFDGWVRRKGEKLELGQFARLTDAPDGLPELSIHELTEEPTFPNLARDHPDVITDAIVTGPDVDTELEDSWQIAPNAATRDRLQENRPKTYARPFVITSYQQLEQATQLVSYYSRAVADIPLSVRREKAADIQPGNLIMLNFSPSLSRLLCRVMRRSDPAAGNAVSLTVQAERGVGPQPYRPDPDPAPARPVRIEAVALTHARMFQLPVDWPGLTTLPAFVPLAERPSAATLGFEIHFSIDDATYDREDRTRQFALRATLDNDMLDDDAGFDLVASGFDLAILEAQSTAAAGDDTLLLIIDDEIMSVGVVTTSDGVNFNVFADRGRRGSVAAAHTTGAEVWIIPRADLTLVTHASLSRTGGETRYWKLPGYTPGDLQDISTALKLTVTVASTLPGAPTGLTFIAGDDTSFNKPPAFIGGVLAWEILATWTAPAHGRVHHYEWALTLVDSDAVADAAFHNPVFVAEAVIAIQFPLYGYYYFRVRTVDEYGVAGPWAGGSTNLLTTFAQPAGNMTEQNSDQVAVSGIQTGNGASVVKVRTRSPIHQRVVTTGGAPSETFNIDLTGLGFATRPDTGLISASSPDFGVEYWPGNPGNSSTNAVITLFRRDGTNIAAGSSIELHGEFTEYD